MPTKIDWRPSDDAGDPPGTLIGRVIYSDNRRAVYSRERRGRLHLHHVLHAPARDGVCNVCLKPWPCPTPFKQAQITWDWPRRIDPRLDDAPAVPDDLATAARDFLADWLADEDWFGSTESRDWFGALARHVRGLAISDRRVVAAARYVDPLFEDEDDRIEAVIYPNGSAIRFVELTPWGGDFDAYFLRFCGALGRDWATWQALVERDGPNAKWPAEGVRLTRAGLPAPPHREQE